MKLLPLCSLVVLVGCGPLEEASVSAEAGLETREDASYLAVNAMWRTREIKVCWVDDGWETQKQWVQSAVEANFNTQNAYFAMRFVGWKRCLPGERAVRVRQQDVRPHAVGLGERSERDSGASVILNFTFDDWGYWNCNYYRSHEECVRTIAVHEFGHVAGLAHEQSRADTPASCTEEGAREEVAGAVASGAWDVQSAMNYCSLTWDNGGQLSVGDQYGLGMMYPNSVEALANYIWGFTWQAKLVLSSMFCGAMDECLPADVNGDGVLDTVGFNRNSDTVEVQYGVWDTWGYPDQWHEEHVAYGSELCGYTDLCRLGDVDGDKRADLVIFKRDSSGTAKVALNTGSAFVVSETYTGFCSEGGADCQLADVDADGLLDLVEFRRGGSGDVNLALRKRYWYFGWSWTAFAPKTLAHDWFCVGQEQCALGDVNGDKRADLIGFSKHGPVFVAFSASTSFYGTGIVWHDYFCVNNERCRVGDFNGDGRADIMALREDGYQFIAYSEWNKFTTVAEVRNTQFCVGPRNCRVADMDRDGKADLIAYSSRSLSIKARPDDPLPPASTIYLVAPTPPAPGPDDAIYCY